MNKQRLLELAGILNETQDDEAEHDAMLEKRAAAVQPHLDAVSKEVENAVEALVKLGVSREDAVESIVEDIRYMLHTFL